MEIQILNHMCCPGCRSALALEEKRVQGSKVLDGVLSCAACAASYAVKDGVALFSQGVPGDASDFSSQWRCYYAELYKRTDTLYGRSREQEVEDFLAIVGLTREDIGGKILLDAGCGSGRLALSLAELGATVVGADLYIDPELSARGRKMAGCSLVQADLRALPFKQESFDIVASLGVIHHLAEPAPSFADLSRLVKRGGSFTIYVYLKDRVRYLRLRPIFRALGIHLLPPHTRWRFCRLLGFSCKLLLADILQTRAEIPGMADNFALGFYDSISPAFAYELHEEEALAWFRQNGFPEVTQDRGGNFCGRKI